MAAGSPTGGGADCAWDMMCNVLELPADKPFPDSVSTLSPCSSIGDLTAISGDRSAASASEASAAVFLPFAAGASASCLPPFAEGEPVAVVFSYSDGESLAAPHLHIHAPLESTESVPMQSCTMDFSSTMDSSCTMDFSMQSWELVDRTATTVFPVPADLWEQDRMVGQNELAFGSFSVQPEPWELDPAAGMTLAIQPEPWELDRTAGMALLSTTPLSRKRRNTTNQQPPSWWPDVEIQGSDAQNSLFCSPMSSPSEFVPQFPIVPELPCSTAARGGTQSNAAALPRPLDGSSYQANSDSWSESCKRDMRHSMLREFTQPSNRQLGLCIHLCPGEPSRQAESSNSAMPAGWSPERLVPKWSALSPISAIGTKCSLVGGVMKNTFVHIGPPPAPMRFTARRRSRSLPTDFGSTRSLWNATSLAFKFTPVNSPVTPVNNSSQCVQTDTLPSRVVDDVVQQENVPVRERDEDSLLDETETVWEWDQHDNPAQDHHWQRDPHWEDRCMHPPCREGKSSQWRGDKDDAEDFTWWGAHSHNNHKGSSRPGDSWWDSGSQYSHSGTSSHSWRQWSSGGRAAKGSGGWWKGRSDYDSEW